MPKQSKQTQETSISYSPAGIFSLQRGRLAASWSMRAMKSGNPIPINDLIRIFSSKLSPDHDSRRSVVAKVQILDKDTDGVTELQLLGHAYLEP